MKLLLDTHVFIWWAGEPAKLSPKALELLENADNFLTLSVASIWEMQIKMQLGKLSLDMPLKKLIESQQQSNDLQILAVKLHHVLALNNLPPYHNDPFDRLLIAQSSSENLTLISKDRKFSEYAVGIIW
jgi:PIN domain nuclease of toxin-antitoxin system